MDGGGKSCRLHQMMGYELLDSSGVEDEEQWWEHTALGEACRGGEEVLQVVADLFSVGDEVQDPEIDQRAYHPHKEKSRVQQSQTKFPESMILIFDTI